MDVRSRTIADPGPALYHAAHKIEALKKPDTSELIEYDIVGPSVKAATPLSGRYVYPI